MPRQAREKSESGIYHVMLRGINRQIIFEDDEDSEMFLQILKDYKSVCGYMILAYCLMNNHVHILIKTEKEELSQVFKRICGKFVYWYNNKYRRIGHLFQDRFKSEPIETDIYLLTVVRYIHQNPLKANSVKKIEDYKYSSYNEYVFGRNENVTDTSMVLGMVGLKGFIDYHSVSNDDKCLELQEREFRLTDEEAKHIIIKVSKCDNLSEFQELDRKYRDKFIKKFKERGLSIRQISRLTGISKGIVEKT